MLYLFGWRNAEIWVFSTLVPKSIGHILPQNTQISLFIILLHSLNRCFYLHAFPTQLTYTNINSLAYSFRVFPTDSPSLTMTWILHRFLVEPTSRGEGGKTFQACSTHYSSGFYPTDLLFQAMILPSIKREKNHFHSEGKHAAMLMQYSNVQCNHLWEDKMILF